MHSVLSLMKNVNDEDEDHDFIGLNTLIIVGMILLCLTIGHIIRKYNFHLIPPSSAHMLLGFIIGAILTAFGEKEASAIMFDSEIFFFILLPPIILDAGYHLKKKLFFRNFSSILLFAVIGTLISAVIIGYGLYGIASLHWIPLDPSSPVECLLFGALISAVDPIATLSILGSPDVKADPTLYALIFGESVLNDAISIVLYRSIELFSSDFQHNTIWSSLGTFIGIAIGGSLVGFTIGLLSSLFFRKTNFHQFPHFEFLFLLLFSYTSYIIAETFHLSGIMSLFFCGISLSHYAFYNLSESSKITSNQTFHTLAILCETFLFAYIGITASLSFLPYFKLQWSLSFIFFAILFCLVSRFLNIFPLSLLANIGRKKKISAEMMIVMWISGLRGCIAFALAMKVPTTNHSYIVTTTLAVVIVTTLVIGGLTEPILRKLNLKSIDDDSSSLSDPSRSFSSSISSDISVDGHVKTGFHRWWANFDRDYIQYYFGGRFYPLFEREASESLLSN